MSPNRETKLASVEEIERGLLAQGYIGTRQIATAIFLAESLRKPILVEGPAGVGKTDLARATADFLALPLVRLQCYEGLDESRALYEWKYGKQLLYTQILKDKLGEILEGTQGLGAAMERLHSLGDLFFSEGFLQPRPLLQAVRAETGAVLLIDEVDKSDEEFEAFLLEVLSDYQVSIPELGTLTAKVPPLVFLTSNNARDMSDALKRRCLHLHIAFPGAKVERQIVAARVPQIEERLRRQLVAFVQSLRERELRKRPSVAETIDWARTLLLLHADALEPELVRTTLNVLLKFQEDIESVERELAPLIRKASDAVPGNAAQP